MKGEFRKEISDHPMFAVILYKSEYNCILFQTQATICFRKDQFETLRLHLEYASYFTLENWNEGKIKPLAAYCQFVHNLKSNLMVIHRNDTAYDIYPNMSAGLELQAIGMRWLRKETINREKGGKRDNHSQAPEEMLLQRVSFAYFSAYLNLTHHSFIRKKNRIPEQYF